MAWQIQPNFMREVNQLLQELQLPWRVIKSVKPDGDCFFHAVFAQIQDPSIRLFTHPRALVCKSSLELRVCVVDWAKRQTHLKDVEGFKVIPNWNKYLEDMRKTGKWADQHIICITAMFLGKNILLATDTSTKERPWHPIEVAEDGPYTHPPITLGYLRERHFEPIVRNPKTEEEECQGCEWKGTSLRGHLVRTRKNCKFFNVAQTSKAISAEAVPAPTSPTQDELVLLFTI